MMAIRTIPFGYEVISGKNEINQEEAKIINKIFNMYSEGRTLKEIADYLIINQVVFYEDKVEWNKNKINRIIENEKYKGTSAYPAIVSEYIFNQANAVKNRKTCKQEKQSKEIEFLKTICFCNNCGARYKRINTWGKREKWLCTKDCKCSVYIDDSVIINAIEESFKFVRQDPNLLDKKAASQYKPNNSVMREEKELNRLLAQQKLDFRNISKCILKGASMRFDCCDYDENETTEELKRDITECVTNEHIEYPIMKKYIKQVRINQDGRFSTVFINNASVITNQGVIRDAG